MELRHLRYFLVMAEELHFARAADRLHIEQSPLSRTMKKLEDDLGVTLFERNTHGTRITLAGRTLIDHAKRILATVDQMKASVDAVRAGIGAQLRIGLLESFTQPRLPDLITLNRTEEPGVEILLQEMPFSEQMKCLRDGLLDVALSWTEADADGLIKEKLWDDAVAVVLPAHHRLAKQKALSLEEVAEEVLLVARPDKEPGWNTQVAGLFASVGKRPIRVSEIITSLGMMTPLVAAGYGAGLILMQQADAVHHPDIVVRPIKGVAGLTTYMIRADGEMPPALQRFVNRARKVVYK
jgi:DNA-binding transcriptional LysR family regulator